PRMRLIAALVLALPLLAQQQQQPPQQRPAAEGPAPPAPAVQANNMDEVLKRVDDLMWHFLLDDIAEIDKIEYTSLPPARVQNPKVPGATNPLIIRAYTFTPKKLDRSKKQPLIVFCHQGVHANQDTRDAHIFRELLEQGYTIVSTDYRGSTGYGRGFY